MFIWSDEIGVGKERFLCMIAALVLLARSYLHNTRFLKSNSINQIMYVFKVVKPPKAAFKGHKKGTSGKVKMPL